MSTRVALAVGNGKDVRLCLLGECCWVHGLTLFRFGVGGFRDWGFMAVELG